MLAYLSLPIAADSKRTGRDFLFQFCQYFFFMRQKALSGMALLAL